MRLVDVDKLERGEVDNYGWKEEVVYAVELDNAPTVDAVPVVRCKDCKFRKEGADGNWCVLHEGLYARAEYFCADGERRATPGDDLKALVDELCDLNDENLAQRVTISSDVQWCLSELSDILEADIEAVVRCEDCVHWTMGKYPDHGNCEIGKYGRDASDFCSYGERKKYE